MNRKSTTILVWFLIGCLRKIVVTHGFHDDFSPIADARAFSIGIGIAIGIGIGFFDAISTRSKRTPSPQ
jgi:hypothetical protein